MPTGPPPEGSLQLRHFLQPLGAAQQQYEILRARFVEGRPFQYIENHFGLSRTSAWHLCRNASPQLLEKLFARKPRAATRKPDSDELRAMLVEWRKQNYSVQDISRFAREHGRPISPSGVGRVLREEGFSRLPRRADEERPQWARPEPADYADAQALSLPQGTRITTRWGGVLLFLPFLTQIKFDRQVREAGYPGSRMIPPAQALLSLLILKLIGRERRGHVMDICDDPGVALFAGLNVLPKTTALSDYSSRMGPTPHRRLMKSLDQAMYEQGWMRGGSFNLDFHTIAYFGELGRLERNYVPRRSHAERSVLTFFAQEYQSRMLCYANANLVRAEQNEEVLRFVDFWEQTTGHPPGEVVFDSKLTTYAVLGKLRKRKIHFLTLRRRSPKVVADLRKLPKSAWKACELEISARKYRHPLMYEQKVQLTGCPYPLRQIAAINLGREEPTLLLTDDFARKPEAILTRYAQRTLIENSLGEAVHFFHVDALSSSIRLKIDLDCVLTVLASLCYQWLARQLKGFEGARAKTIWRKFVDRPATIRIEKKDLLVTFHRHNHAPLLMEAGISRKEAQVPWLRNRVVRYRFK